MEADGDRSRVIERASQHLADMPPALAGAGRHRQMFRTIFKVGCGYDLTPPECLSLLREEYNSRCRPRWATDQLAEKISAAYQSTSCRGWLLGAQRSPHRERPFARIDRNLPEPTFGEFTRPRAREMALHNWRKIIQAAKSLDRLPGARAGEDRHARTVQVAREIGPGCGLTPEDCFDLLWNEWNGRCEPPWTAKKLERRVRDAYLSAPQRRWSRQRWGEPMLRECPDPSASAPVLATA